MCTTHVAHGLRGRPRTARHGARAHTEAVTALRKLEHPRRRGHPPGMWVEAIAHGVSSRWGRGENWIGDDVLRRGEGSGGRRWSFIRVEGERKLGSTIHREKAARGGLGAPLTVEEFATVEAAGQRRWQARTATWSASDTGDGTVGTGAREARRRRSSDSGEALSERRCRSAPLWHGASAWQPRGDGVPTGGLGARNSG
jgi:hypothetical protein